MIDLLEIRWLFGKKGQIKDILVWRESRSLFLTRSSPSQSRHILSISVTYCMYIDDPHHHFPSFNYSDCAPAFVAPQGRSEETARRLWDVSCELLGIEWDWFNFQPPSISVRQSQYSFFEPSFYYGFAVLFFEGFLHNKQSGNTVRATIMWSCFFV